MRREDIGRLKTAYKASAVREVEFSKAVGVDVPEVRRLHKEIFNDLEDKVFGIKWWAPHHGTKRRILASHYLLECVSIIETNLTEAGLHLLEAVDYWERESDFLANSVSTGQNGGFSIKMPRRKTPEEDLPYQMATLHAVGFFRALVGALDCLGASVVGVLALPVDLRRTDIIYARKSLEKASKPMQADFREKLRLIIADSGPTGWLEWLNDYRNMVVHRGRRPNMTQLRPKPVRILGPDGHAILRTIAVRHLPRDPNLSQIEAFADPPRTPVLTEDATVTMRGSLNSSLHLIRSVAAELVEVWKIRRQTPSLLPQPKENWPKGLCLESTGFIGYAPDSLPYNPHLWIAHPALGKQLKTAALSDDLRHLWQSFD